MSLPHPESREAQELPAAMPTGSLTGDSRVDPSPRAQAEPSEPSY